MTVSSEHLGPESKSCDQCGKVFHRDKRCTWAHWGRSRFCSRKCSAIYSASIIAKKRGAASQEFERWIDKSGDCWNWTGGKFKDGYAAFNYCGKTYRAHRFSVSLNGITIPEGYVVCHKCDNPICVKPDHLFVGTHADNMRDMVAKGRHGRSRRAA